MTSDNEKMRFMRRAVELSELSVINGGGPFGAVVVKDGEIVGEGANCVTLNNDPTAHAEVSAIRQACRNLDTFTLEGCEIYTSCEPCPMCLGAIYWARIPVIYYGNTRREADSIGFSDDDMYRQFALPPSRRSVRMHRLLEGEAAKAFRMWTDKSDRIRY